ncbi:MAG TPA: ribosome-associated translation inhibitor RaiA [Thermoanaerobaculia bacterium]|jgi:putative sigma-54 modulation protein
MAVECRGRNVQVTSTLRELAEERTDRLERHLGGPARVRVVLSQEKHRFGAEVIATHRRRRWKAQEETADPRAAMTAAFEKIDAQAKRDSEKRRDRKHRAPSPEWRVDVLSSRALAGAAAAGPDENRIVRTDRLPIKPMSVEEAALRIESTRQEFLVFRDASTERICVLYKRRDGDFGLIVPEC